MASPDCKSFVSSSLEALNCALNDSDCLAASLIAPPPNAPVAALDVSFSPFDSLSTDEVYFFTSSFVSQSRYAPSDVSYITVVYTNTWEDESTMDTYWNQMLTRYATARVNEVVGRARSKYKSSEGLYEVDSTMLDTALEDITKIFEELRSNDLLLPSEL